MNSITLKFAKLDVDSFAPTLASVDAAAYDLYSTRNVSIDREKPSVIINTGIVVQIPVGYVGLICSRSGMAANSGLYVLNAPGVIDSDYRGELRVILSSARASGLDYGIMRGDRIAQLMIVPLPKVTLEEVSVSDMDATERGQCGFGSTGRGL